MPINLYYRAFANYFGDEDNRQQIGEAANLLKKGKRIFFIGNGGSNSICSHMYEDYAKIGGFQTFAFSDPAMITCFANDYGYENAMAEWLKIYFDKNDILIAVSSSGKSPNILNATDVVESRGGKLITLSGFQKDNPLSQKGRINFHIPIENYGIVECYHQVILHIILDSLQDENK